MKPETAELLSVIGAELRGKDRVSVEGHTDARKLSRENYSNWELSCDRANAARRVLEPILEPGQIDAIRGYADTQLRDAEDPMDPKNRRVTILVKPPAPAPEAGAAGEPATSPGDEPLADGGTGGEAAAAGEPSASPGGEPTADGGTEGEAAVAPPE
jgi:chemotaxis protein MotB